MERAASGPHPARREHDHHAGGTERLPVAGRSYVRKALEAWFAMLMELLWGKRRILEVYLNVIEWGDGIYGAEAAARSYFGVPAAQLSPRQAALLAAAAPPSAPLRPRRPRAAISAREPRRSSGAPAASTLKPLAERATPARGART
jgi:hypothetical protein